MADLSDDLAAINDAPYGFDCMSCVYAVKHPRIGAAKRQCRGMPPTATMTGMAGNGEPVYGSYYRIVEKGDWCGQHPSIKARAEPFAMPLSRA